MKRKLYKFLSHVLIAALCLQSCSLLEPENDNHNTLKRVYDDPAFAEGLLLTAYTLIPTNDYAFDDVATDDAVSNDRFNSYLRMATGEWSASYDPQSLWNDCNRAILYINQFLSVVDSVPWKWTNPDIAALYIRKFKGESYALRGLFKYFLLRNHGGPAAGGQLLGTPVYDEFITSEAQFSAPRADFQTFFNSAIQDFETALTYLPADYGNVGTPPTGFEDVNVDNYNEVFGDFALQRMSGRHVLAMRARLALLAASPAFNLTNEVTLWENAANEFAGLLNDIGGVDGLDPNGHHFFLKAQVDEADITTGNRLDLQEILWRRPIYNNNAREADHFPPSLYGRGRINPTQNLVDAFPMANGFPIDDPNGAYDEQHPYANRDPRLSLYIVYNGSQFKGQAINTSTTGGDDGLDQQQTSTRTGYYLKKLLREDVNVDPASPSNQKHFNTHIRYTELFLSFAEAANEAWGPDGSAAGFSAREVIAAIRERAGIDQPDVYLASIADKETMRELIRNERRLELCFEGFRFWDLRRWKADLTEPARGVRIDGDSYTYFTVEARSYNNDYMHYGPIPQTEVVKFGFEQNNGW